MSDNLLSSLGFYLVSDMVINKTHCVSYVTNMDSLFHNNTSEYRRQYMIDKLLCLFGVKLVIGQLFKQTLCVSYFTYIHLVITIFRPVN